MQNKYQDQITTLLEQAEQEMPATYQLEFKNVFGAVGGYVNGHIFISCGRFGVALKLPQSVLDTLFHKKEAGHLKYFPNGHIKKEYAVLSKRILEDNKRMKALIDESINYALLS